MSKKTLWLNCVNMTCMWFAIDTHYIKAGFISVKDKIIFRLMDLVKNV